ncbi:hypothetical protein Tco_0715253 [Tanacetum coccineum]
MHQENNPSTSELLKNLNKAQDLLTKFDECIKRITTLSPLEIEVKEMKDIFKQIEDEVDQCSVANKSFEIENKQLLINNDRVLEENIASDIMCTYLRSLNEVYNCGKCKSLDVVLLDLPESNKYLSELRKRFAKLKEYIITLDTAFQNHKEQMILNDPDTINKQLLVKTINNQSVEINDLKVQLQDKLHVINELKHLLAQKSQKTPCELPIVDYRIQKIEDENTRAKMKLQTDSLQQKLNDQIYENNKLREQLKGKFFESQMNHNGTIVNTKLSKPSTSGTKLYSVTPLLKSKNNRVMHRDYLKVTKEHVATLQELLEEARALKPLDEHIGRVSSTNASGSKLRSNTKNDRIPQPSSRSMKNKLEAHHRKFKSSSNKNNHVSDCNANKRQKRKVAKSTKQKVKSEWKPTGKIFKTVGLKWVPTGRTFNLVGKLCPLLLMTRPP